MAAGGAVVLALSPLVPSSYDWVLWPFTPFLLFGLPVGALLLLEPLLRRAPWYSPVCSALLFTAAWAVWSARDYYYELEAR